MTDPLEKIQQFSRESFAENHPFAWFDRLYQSAQGDVQQIPWAKLTPYQKLEEWVSNTNFSCTQKNILVIGCGLGDDAEFLAEKGGIVTAFDVSPTAISWCQQRFPLSQVNYQVVDVFNTPFSWQNYFDLVVESRTIQALPITVRRQLIKSIANLVKPQGKLLIITRLREDDKIAETPPWGMSSQELLPKKWVKASPF